MATSYGSENNDGPPSPGSRGSRRRKLAAMAGNLYRTGQQAVTEIRESYAQSRAAGVDGGYDGYGNMHIPGSFPDVAITSQGGEQMVLFPSYAKRHARKDWSEEPAHDSQNAYGSLKDEDYWRREWERNEDEKAIVDVDVRGWIYAPNTGPMTRRNRIMMGLARQLSGIPAPRADAAESQPATHHQMHEKMREQEKISQEAARIEEQGQQEKDAAYHGRYSEKPYESADSDSQSVYPNKSRVASFASGSAPTSPTLGGRQNTTANDLTEAELVMANANLMARVAPFMTNPLVSLPITIFFYNDTNSQSRTVMTNDAGHFILRAPLDFIPTNVRVLANERLSATQDVHLIEPRGVSLISDIDDTIKRSNISGGAREIFRNTFVRELADLTVDGVKGWYTKMHDLGVTFHYCSNSPWQLFPVLASFFKLDGLPPGSLHLKQYSGMLQGIFEPVAERKKSTLTRLLRDFPERKFLLVGDSGEADLEVYTELALAHPGRVLAIFIRDVTTPENPTFFETGYPPARKKMSSLSLDEAHRTSQGSSSITIRQNSSPAVPVTDTPSSGPAMGTLIDFTQEPEETKLETSMGSNQLRSKSTQSTPSASASDLLAAKKAPPPRPNKPAALRSTPSNNGTRGDASSQRGPSPSSSESGTTPPPLPARKPVRGAADKEVPHPLTQVHNSSQQSTETGKSSSNGTSTASKPGGRDNPDRQQATPPPPPPPRRRVPPSTHIPSRPTTSNRAATTTNNGNQSSSTANSDIDNIEPLPPSLAGPPPTQAPSSGRTSRMSPSSSPNMGPVNRKLELWRRRLARAHEQLDRAGVALYTWRRGQDVVEEAVGIVERAKKEIQRGGGGGEGQERR